MPASFTAQLDAVARPWLKALGAGPAAAPRANRAAVAAGRRPRRDRLRRRPGPGVDALPRGLAAAAPWLVLLAAAAAARGLANTPPEPEPEPPPG
jgi:ATP-binding cassette subfamily C protein CydD